MRNMSLAWNSRYHKMNSVKNGCWKLRTLDLKLELRHRACIYPVWPAHSAKCIRVTVKSWQIIILRVHNSYHPANRWLSNYDKPNTKIRLIKWWNNKNTCWKDSRRLKIRILMSLRSLKVNYSNSSSKSKNK